MAYRAAYQIDYNLGRGKMIFIRPLIIFNNSIFHPNFRNILAVLDIDYIFVDNEGKIVRQSLDARRHGDDYRNQLLEAWWNPSIDELKEEKI